MKQAFLQTSVWHYLIYTNIICALFQLNVFKWKCGLNPNIQYWWTEKKNHTALKRAMYLFACNKCSVSNYYFLKKKVIQYKDDTNIQEAFACQTMRKCRGCEPVYMYVYIYIHINRLNWNIVKLMGILLTQMLSLKFRLTHNLSASFRWLAIRYG